MGSVALTKPAGLPLFTLFTGFDFTTPPSVILTQGIANQPNAKMTFLSCPSEVGKEHALTVSPQGVVSAAWVTTANQVRFTTNTSGSWAYSHLGPGDEIELVLTSAGLNILLEQNGDIYHLVPC